MRGYAQLSFLISKTLVKIYISRIIINRGKNTIESVGTVLKICFSRIFSKPRKSTLELVGTVLNGYQPCIPPLRPGFNSRPRDRMWAEFQSISARLLRVLRFSSLSKVDSQPISSGCGALFRGHTWVVFRGLAPSRQHSSFGPTSSSRALSNSVSDCE